MNDIQKPELECQEPGEYVAPEILTYSPEDFLGLLGPAQGYGGSGGGGGGGVAAAPAAAATGSTRGCADRCDAAWPRRFEPKRSPARPSAGLFCSLGGLDARGLTSTGPGATIPRLP